MATYISSRWISIGLVSFPKGIILGDNRNVVFTTCTWWRAENWKWVKPIERIKHAVRDMWKWNIILQQMRILVLEWIQTPTHYSGDTANPPLPQFDNSITVYVRICSFPSIQKYKAVKREMTLNSTA